MMSGRRRLAISQECETVTRRELEDVGCVVEPYGQALLSESARALLRRNPAANHRWLADFLVQRGQEPIIVLVDAKWSAIRWRGRGTHAIEMRSVLQGRKENLPTLYVASWWDGQAFKDFHVFSLDMVRFGGSPCCADCYFAFMGADDARPGTTEVKHAPPVHGMEGIPVQCSKWQGQTQDGSGTPFFTVRAEFARPLTEVFP